MKLFKADHQRRIKLDGVTNPVPRPVDINQSQTGYTNLRTLRIYRFEPEATIDGHAEEDEVLIVVLAGSMELSMSAGNSHIGAVRMNVAENAQNLPCVAYLPPHGSYRLVPETPTDIAYIRATPRSGRLPRFFTSQASSETDGVTVLLDESAYAEKLGIRLLKIDASQREVSCASLRNAGNQFEAFLHFRNLSAGAVVSVATASSAHMALASWDTVAVRPTEQPLLKAQNATLHILSVFAR